AASPGFETHFHRDTPGSAPPLAPPSLPHSARGGAFAPHPALLLEAQRQRGMLSQTQVHFKHAARSGFARAEAPDRSLPARTKDPSRAIPGGRERLRRTAARGSEQRTKFGGTRPHHQSEPARRPVEERAHLGAPTTCAIDRELGDQRIG